MSEIFQFVFLRDDFVVSKWNFMFFVVLHMNHLKMKKFKIFLKLFSLNFNLKRLYITFMLNFGCELSKASD